MSSSLTDDVLKAFSAFPGKTLFVTVGNSLRSDDGIGPFIAARLEGCAVIDAGVKPENIIEDATALKPTRIVIIDAADFGGEPGEAKIISREHIPETTLSTHTIPLPVVTALLEEDTGAEIIFIGIQPKSVEMGEGLSPEVEKTALEIINAIKEKQNLDAD
jgi:hydrogenase 3 maturation protease